MFPISKWSLPLLFCVAAVWVAFASVGTGGCAPSSPAKIQVLMVCVDDGATDLDGDQIVLNGFRTGVRYDYAIAMHKMADTDRSCSEHLKAEPEIDYRIIGVKAGVRSINVLTAEKSGNVVDWRIHPIKVGENGFFSFRYSTKPAIPTVTTDGVLEMDVPLGKWWEK